MFKFKENSSRACWLVGHRGAMGHAPENTMASFLCAQKMGADFVECDVHLSKDRKCVVMHDESVERTTDGSGLIRDLISGKIKSLDAGSWFSERYKGERALLLQELLEWAKKEISLMGLPMGVVIEIKNEPVRYLGIAEKVIETVRKAHMEERVILISFDHGVVKRAKIADPHISTGILYNRPLENPFRRADEVRADALFPRRHLVVKSLVREAHKNKLFLATWTVNEVGEMKKMLNCGVDALATNFPEKLNRLLLSR